MTTDRSTFSTRRIAVPAGLAICLAAGLWLIPEAGAAAETTAAQSIWTLERWSPDAAGIGIGVLSWLAFLLSDNSLGASGAYAKVAGMAQKRLGGATVDENAYYRKHRPAVDWGVMLLLGIVVGAFLSAWLSGSLALKMVPDLWAATMGTGGLSRWMTALAGGVLIGIGSRWAGGCTSGHGISGTLQLVLSSWIAVACFFVSGAVTALIRF